MSGRTGNTVAERLTPPATFAVPVLHDNFAWIVVGEDNAAVVVDPGEATPVVAALARHGLRLAAILATHHHHDHVGGIAALLDAAEASGVGAGRPASDSDSPRDGAPQPVQVWGSDYDVARCRIPRATHAAKDGEPITVAGVTFTPLAVPGHTLGAVAYYSQARALLFTGDTLFLGGCGRLFEGDAAMMWQSLQRLRALPEDTRICCGHDYVGKNLRFAGTVLPPADVAARDDATAERSRQDASGDAASPPLPPPWATLATERRRNPFLRADAALLQQALGKRAGEDVFAELRRRRDHFS